jgi:hypothetical protein
MNPRAAKKKGLDTMATGELFMVIEAYFPQIPADAWNNIDTTIKMKGNII